MRIRRVVVLALGSFVLTGCALFAGKADYAAYREVRIAEDEHTRLRAMQRYIAEQPNGQWAKGIQAERVRVEPEMWAENRGSMEGLRFYLEAFPDGPHAQEAQPMLAALERVAGHRQNEAEAAREVERARREALLERQRTWMTRASQFWTRTLVGITNWNNPIADVARANPAFSRAFGSNPRPRCSREECIKFYLSSYGIPVPGSTRLERQLEMFLRLRMRRGRVVRAEMLLPNKGFSRWYEQEHRTIVVDEDPTQRQEAINWAIEKFLPALREVAPDARAVDVVPEPIDPPSVRAPNQPDEGAAFAPGDEALQAELEQAEEPEPAPAQEGPWHARSTRKSPRRAHGARGRGGGRRDVGSTAAGHGPARERPGA